MTLSKENRIAVLKDILNNHTEDCCASKSEYQQAQRIAAGLKNDHAEDKETYDVLHQIHGYCQKGCGCNDHASHITEFASDLTGWVEHLKGLEKK